ncbi:DNA helicase INO80-like [Orbicella faveolata]|uniref:DNA helicase INO80-like n=1 Tax=Orbicella faveolata TaxID=48498 RepID=UPI0009E5D1FE|nr:DNA helicase INO80-like [Orbicella faveolata]
MASPQPSLAAPLHVQHLEKALRLDPFLSYLEGVFTDPYSTNISDDDSELGDNEEEPLPKGEEGLLNGVTDGMIINGSLSRDELRIDKTRLYNFSKIKKDRRWLKEVLLSDSSDTSCDEDDEAPLTEEDLQEMLWLHKQQKIAQQMYCLDKDVSCCDVCNSIIDSKL